MRPPHEAGEVGKIFRPTHIWTATFNEAPARGGGGLVASPSPDPVVWAFNEAPARGGGGRSHHFMLQRKQLGPSMRPPHEAGEVGKIFRPTHIWTATFNEAPARGGGGLVASPSPDPVVWAFNEAPARGGGGRGGQGRIPEVPFRLQ